MEEVIKHCNYQWKDGWGSHRCLRLDDHEGDCLCGCDARGKRPTPRGLDESEITGE